MPGPNSLPWAVAHGVEIKGKTALRRAKLRSGQGAYRDTKPAPKTGNQPSKGATR